jgi:glycosyltransferase involved in cell wall biosynthesis
MRIGIDVRYLSHGLLGGVHTYVKNFVPELVVLAHDHEIFLYADTKRPFELTRLPDNVTLRCLPWSNSFSSVYHDLFMRREMRRDRLDVVHFPANYGLGPQDVATIVTLHDAINILPLSEILGREFLRGHVKSLRTAVMIVYLHAWSREALRRADLMLTVSQHASREIARYSGLEPGKIRSIPHGLSPDLRRINDPSVLGDVRLRHELPRSFVLADALKNPAVLLRAWRLLPEQIRANRRIVFFSRRPEVLPIVHEAVRAGEARLLLRPAREDLIALYSMADAFVFPSWIEGFGIPVLEAMTCGAPVIASDRGSIPEVAGAAALLADAEDERAFAAHLCAVLEQPEIAASLRSRGIARARQFSWTNTARAILEAYTASEAARPQGKRMAA